MSIIEETATDIDALESLREQIAEDPAETGAVLTVNLNAAILGFGAVLPHASKDPIVPIITGVQIDATRITATDRFSIGTYDFAHKRATEGRFSAEQLSGASEAFMVPRELVEWIVKLNPRTLRIKTMPEAYVLRISAVKDAAVLDGYGEPRIVATRAEIIWAGDNATNLQHEGTRAERSQEFDPLQGDFPPVMRLVEGFKPADSAMPVSLNATMLERFTGWAKRVGKNSALTFELSEGNGSGKPGPVRVSLEAFTGLLQPNLLTR